MLFQKGQTPQFIEIRRIAYQETYPLRSAILWPTDPSQVPLPTDPDGIHFGLFTSSAASASPISVISLFLEPDSQARFRKFATAAEAQGKGYGSQLLDHMLSEAARQGVKRIWCTARTNQTGFYAKRGMSIVDGTESLQKGVAHIIMEKML
ncbi:hypothetical protein HDU87_008486 [Geranomyces variabilis]|uniref:N-acetyltransferase domain-containing protein n=1 Tax=Geranomyces variabilis TaxID=109894 RepID=A0AAD5TPD6_9FUNG|nr:hypothetical protein HDU87_008486 [Geranomyces variabilis]